MIQKVDITAQGVDVPTDDARPATPASASPPPTPLPPSMVMGAETRRERLSRTAHQGRLQLYASGVVILAAALIALAASNTARVHINWLVGSSRVSLVWLVLVTALIGWTLGVVSSLRFQWLTRAPYPKRVRSAKRKPA